MIQEEYVLVTELCVCYATEDSFFDALQDNGLIELQCIGDAYYVHHDSLPKIEKILRLRQSLDLNLEAIDVVLQLLDKMEAMQAQLQHLQSALRSQEQRGLQ